MCDLTYMTHCKSWHEVRNVAYVGGRFHPTSSSGCVLGKDMVRPERPAFIPLVSWASRPMDSEESNVS